MHYLDDNNLSVLTEDICFRARNLKADSSGESAERIFYWIAENVKYERNRVEQGAEYAYIYRVGACDEHADLFVSMARCIGIPSRRITGSLINESEANGHAWTEYYDGGWVYLDPSSKSRPHAYTPDKNHVAACIGEGAYTCGVGYSYTYTRGKPKIRVEEKIYLA